MIYEEKYRICLVNSCFPYFSPFDYHTEIEFLTNIELKKAKSFLAMSYKKDIFAVFAYDFELLHNI